MIFAGARSNIRTFETSISTYNFLILCIYGRKIHSLNPAQCPHQCPHQKLIEVVLNSLIPAMTENLSTAAQAARDGAQIMLSKGRDWSQKQATSTVIPRHLGLHLNTCTRSIAKNGTPEKVPGFSKILVFA
jgi:hypothetical protein